MKVDPNQNLKQIGPEVPKLRSDKQTPKQTNRDYNNFIYIDTSHIDTGLYLDTLLENSFLPLITFPTRTAGTTATLLDHIGKK